LVLVHSSSVSRYDILARDAEGDEQEDAVTQGNGKTAAPVYEVPDVDKPESGMPGFEMSENLPYKIDLEGMLFNRPIVPHGFLLPSSRGSIGILVLSNLSRSPR